MLDPKRTVAIACLQLMREIEFPKRPPVLYLGQDNIGYEELGTVRNRERRVWH